MDRADPRQRTAPVSTAHPILALAELAVSEAGNGQQNPSGRLFSVQEIEAELGAAAKLRPRNSGNASSSIAQRLEHLSSFFFEHVQRYGG